MYTLHDFAGEANLAANMSSSPSSSSAALQEAFAADWQWY
jgi:hypothetical protein